MLISSAFDALLSIFMSPMTTAGGIINHLGLAANAFIMISGPIPAGQPMVIPSGVGDCNMRVCAFICDFIPDSVKNSLLQGHW